MRKLMIALATISLVGTSAASVALAAPKHHAAKAQNDVRWQAPVEEFNPWGFYSNPGYYDYPGSYGDRDYHGPKSWY